MTTAVYILHEKVTKRHKFVGGDVPNCISNWRWHLAREYSEVGIKTENRVGFQQIEAAGQCILWEIGLHLMVMCPVSADVQSGPKVHSHFLLRLYRWGRSVAKCGY